MWQKTEPRLPRSAKYPKLAEKREKVVEEVKNGGRLDLELGNMAENLAKSRGWPENKDSRRYMCLLQVFAHDVFLIRSLIYQFQEQNWPKYSTLILFSLKINEYLINPVSDSQFHDQMPHILHTSHQPHMGIPPEDRIRPVILILIFSEGLLHFSLCNDFQATLYRR